MISLDLVKSSDVRFAGDQPSTYLVELIIYNEFLGLISKLTRNVVATGSFWSKWSCYSLLQMNWSNITHDTQVDKQNLRQIENHLLVLLIFQDYSYLYERRLTIREVWYDHGEWGDVQRIKLHILFLIWYSKGICIMKYNKYYLDNFVSM